MGDFNGVSKDEKGFKEAYEIYRTFADLTDDERQKVLAEKNIRLDAANPAMVEIFWEAENSWVKVEASKLYNKAWGMKK